MEMEMVTTMATTMQLTTTDVATAAMAIVMPAVLQMVMVMANLILIHLTIIATMKMKKTSQMGSTCGAIWSFHMVLILVILIIIMNVGSSAKLFTYATSLIHIMQGYIIYPISLSSFQVARLTAISRWVLVKIVYRVEINVNELTMDDVSRIVTEEICDEADPVDSEPPTLGQSNQYPKWKKAMIRHLETIRTKDSVGLSYVICTPERPAEFDSLLHELEYCLPIDGSTAANKRDQRQLYDILDFNAKDDNSRAWLTSKDHQIQGCSGWLALQDLHEGNINYESRLSDLKERLDKHRYTGVSNNNASTLTARLYDIHTKFRVSMLPIRTSTSSTNFTTTSKCLSI